MSGLLQNLLSEDKIRIQQGLEGLAAELPAMEDREFAEAVHAIVDLFHVDPLDHPELLPVLEQAEAVLADQRERAIPVLIQSLNETDLKVHFHLGSVLGRMGYAAVSPLLETYQDTKDPYARIFALYAVGKIRDPKVMEFLPVLFEALEDTHNELRDTAARTLGKICEHVDPGKFDEQTRDELYDHLLAKASDHFAGVRSKAIRSLGKMARFGFLDAEQRDRLAVILGKVLGEDAAGNWDLAYTVRAEAQKARRYI